MLFCISYTISFINSYIYNNVKKNKLVYILILEVTCKKGVTSPNITSIYKDVIHFITV